MSNKILCRNCNAELSEGTAFCPVCGTKNETIVPSNNATVCPMCGVEASANFTFCQNCGTSLTQNYAAAPTNVGSTTAKKKINLKELFKKPVYIAIPVAILLLIVVIAVVAKIKPSGGLSLMYVKDKEIQYSYLSQHKTFELTDRLIDDAGYIDADDYISLSDYILLSDDERYIFYPDRTEGGYTTYYWRDLKADIGNAEASIKIDSEISSQPFLSTDGSKFFYIKGDDSRLYFFDRKTDAKIKLDDEVRSFYVSDSGDYIIYSKYMDDEYTIYEMFMKGSTNDKNKLDSNSRIYSVYPNDKKVFYIKEDSLYQIESGQNKVKITSNLDKVISVVDKNSVYYLKKDEVVNKLSNYVNDDMLSSDKNISDELPAPDYGEAPLYPSEYDYQIETWVDSYWGYERHPETNEWGYWDYTTDEAAYRAAVDEYETKYSAWEEEVNRYNIEYNEAYQRREEKQYREYLREALDSEDYVIRYNEYSLYYWNNGKETLVASDVDSYQLASSSNINAVIYQKNTSSSIGKQKLSEITADDSYYIYDYIYELQEKVNASRKISDDVFLALGEKETTIDCSNARRWTISNAGVICFLDEYDDEKGYGNLMSAFIKNDVVEKPAKIDDDVSAYLLGNDNENIYYYKDLKKGSGDLYLNKKRIASDVYQYSFYNYKGTNKLLYFIDYSDKSESGTLCLFDEGTEIKISDDVYQYVPVNDKNIAYLTDYRVDREKGDLMLYNGKKKPTPIDTDVTILLWNVKNMWGYYWYY